MAVEAFAEAPWIALMFAALVFTEEMLDATVPMSDASPATAVTLLLIPATVVTLLEMPATVLTLLLIPATVVIAFVAVVPSWISARVPMSLAMDARVVTSVELGPASGAPVVALNWRYLPLRLSTDGIV